MESDWRWNVWDIGLSYGPNTLAARIPSPFPGTELWVLNYDNTPYTYQQCFTIFRDVVSISSPVTGPVKNFPYGFAVLDPD